MRKESSRDGVRTRRSGFLHGFGGCMNFFGREGEIHVEVKKTYVLGQCVIDFVLDVGAGGRIWLSIGVPRRNTFLRHNQGPKQSERIKRIIHVIWRVIGFKASD
jgi:hypothetical protein